MKIADEDKAIILLCSLPPSYEHLVTTLTYGKDTIKVDEITAALLAHNQWKLDAGESSQGDSLYTKGDRGRKQDNERSGRRKSRSKSRSRKNIECYKCKEMRHMKRDCPKLKEQNGGKRDEKTVNVARKDDSDSSDADVLSVSNSRLIDAWILDSGCARITSRLTRSGSLRTCQVILVLFTLVMMHAIVLSG